MTKINENTFSIDANKDDHSYGRLINHSSKNINIVPKLIDIDGKPRLYFIAARDIKSGEELAYEYGENRSSVRSKYPWFDDEGNSKFYSL